MEIFSVIGLVFDIIGVLMLFQYGLPSIVVIGDSLLAEESAEDECKRERKNTRIQKLAVIGLFLILFGFIFQLLGVIC